MKQILTLNFFGIVVTPFLILAGSNPFFAIFFVGILSVYFLFKVQKGLLTSIIAWNIGFLFIIGSDGILNYADIASAIGESQVQRAATFFGYSFFIINISYVLFIQRTLHRSGDFDSRSVQSLDYPTKRSMIVIIILYAGFLASKLPGAIEILVSGRFYVIANSGAGGIQSEGQSLWETMVNPLMNIVGYIIPTLIYHNFCVRGQNRKRLLLTFLFSLPVFLTFLFTGTRYFILYSAGTFFTAYLYYNFRPIKRFYSIVLFCLIAFFASSVMSMLRGQGVYMLTESSNIDIQFDKTENTLKYMTMVVDHYDTEDFTYGAATLANLVFWVPRSVWTEKPAMFGYWFIREYRGASFEGGGKHSAPASYLAEAYADFGTIGVLLISIVLGFIFLKIDRALFRFDSIHSIKRIIFFALVPIAFFLPRQINVPLVSFIGILVVILGISFLMRSFKSVRVSF